MATVFKEQRWCGELWPANFVYKISEKTGLYSCTLPFPLHKFAKKRVVEAQSLPACQAEVREAFNAYKAEHERTASKDSGA